MNDDMRKLIDETQRLDREATPGPWHRRDAETENGYVTSAVSLDTADEDGLTPCDLPIVGRTITAGIAGNDAALIAHYRTAAPVLAAEIERLDARLADIEDDARRVLAESCAPDECHCSCVPHLRARLVEVERERDEARLVLAAEQGRQEGAPEGWELLGHGWRRGDLRVRRVGWGWEWSRRDARGRVLAAGVADTARAAMLAASAYHATRACSQAIVASPSGSARSQSQ